MIPAIKISSINKCDVIGQSEESLIVYVPQLQITKVIVGVNDFKNVSAEGPVPPKWCGLDIRINLLMISLVGSLIFMSFSIKKYRESSRLKN